MALPLPKGVSIKSSEGEVEVKGPKGVLKVPVAEGITFEEKDGTLNFSRRDETREQKALHGLTRALVANAVHGVSEGYSRTLQIIGTGYRAEVQGNALNLSLGFSHPVVFDLPEGISAKVEDRNTTVILEGIDKQQIGQVAANLRALRPPDAYKGKGVRFKDERISLKPGKAAAK
jgi:large subunit ribosomal protein L6